MAGIHDQKMFRVVKDRAGWFEVVMRAAAQDERTTDAEERREPLAPTIAGELEMKFESR